MPIAPILDIPGPFIPLITPGGRFCSNAGESQFGLAGLNPLSADSEAVTGRICNDGGGGGGAFAAACNLAEVNLSLCAPNLGAVITLGEEDELIKTPTSAFLSSGITIGTEPNSSVNGRISGIDRKLW